MKILITSYTFDASAKTVDASAFTSLENIQIITNVTDNIIIYNFADATKGGSLSGTVLTLDYDTTSMADADKLQIFIDDGTLPQSDGLTDTELRATPVEVDTGLTQPTTPTDTQPVSAATLPLPSGAATSAKQDTGNTSLSSVDTKLSDLSTRLSESDFDNKTGSLTETAPTTDTASSGLNGRLQRIAQRLTSIIALLPGSLGQKARASSLAVTLSTEDLTALTPPGAITGYATSTKQSDGSQKTQVVDGSGNVIGSTSNALDINIKSGNPTSITANAGTNLNTSTLATEATLAGAIKAEDAAAADGDKGIPALSVRKNTAVATSGADGDYQPLITDTNGKLHVNTGLTQPTTPSDTQPVSAASLPLPAGAATSAKQDTGNTSLASIDTKLPSQGQALAAASVPVVLPAAQITTLTPPAAITGFATSAKQDTLLTELQAKADLTETQPVSLASVPSHAVTNAGTFAVQATLAAETTKIIGAINNLPATVDTNSGSKSASTLRVVLATDQPALTNKLLVTPDSVALPANQSVNVSQVNGVTPLMGAGNTGTGSPRVTIASDQAAIPVTTTPTAPTTIYNGKKTVTTAGTRVTLAASQAVKSVTIKALSTNTGFIYVGDASVASTTGLQLQAGETVSLDVANLNTVNLDSSVNGEGVTYLGTN